MLQDMWAYDLNLYFKIITLIFLSFLLLVNNLKGNLGLVFFERLGNNESNSENLDGTILSFPNIFILVISSFIFTLFMHVLGLSFFADRDGYIFFLDTLVVFLLILLKIGTIFMSAFVLDEDNVFRVFDRELLSYLSLMSLICLVLSFVVLNYNLSSITGVLILIVIAELLWYMRLSYVLLRSTTFNFLYFFSYLCSLEILPTLAVAIYVGII